METKFTKKETKLNNFLFEKLRVGKDNFKKLLAS